MTNNQSVPDSLTATSCSSNNEFSLENVVGMFLTLSLCLLTQPYGSLFYSPPHDDDCHTIMPWTFVFWRLNPLACVSEAIVIYFTLVQAFSLAVKSGIAPELSRRFPFYRISSDRNRRWKRHWHVNAAALLLLRANDHYGDQRGNHDLLKRLLSPSFLSETASETESRGTVPVRTSNLLPGQSSDRIEMQRSAAVATSPEPELGVSRRRMSLLEAGMTVEDNLSDEKLSQLRKALGTNVLAHREKWVDLVTIFSVLVVMVKLSAITLPWDIRVASAFLLTGWSSVQLLLYLFHLHELDDNVAVLVIKTACTHKVELENKLIGVIISVVIAGPLIYLGYCAGFRSFYAILFHHETSFEEGYFQGPVLCVYMLAFIIVIFVPPMILSGIILVIAFKLFHMNNGWIVAFAIFNSGVLGFGYFSVLDKARKAEGASQWIFVTTNIVACFGVIVTIWGFLLGPARLNTFRRGLENAIVVNTILAFYVFAELLCFYNPSGTYKPAFLDSLG